MTGNHTISMMNSAHLSSDPAARRKRMREHALALRERLPADRREHHSAAIGRHLDEQTGAGRKFSQEEIDRNRGYLERVVATDREHRLERLRRGHVVEQLLDLKGKK